MVYYHALRIEKAQINKVTTNIETWMASGDLGWWALKALIIRGEKTGFEMLKQKVKEGDFASKFSTIICKPPSDYISRQNGFAINRMYG